MSTPGADFGHLTERELLIRIYERVDNIATVHEAHAREDKRAFESFDQRLKVLEQFRWVIVGAGVAISAFFTAVARLIPWGFLSHNK